MIICRLVAVQWPRDQLGVCNYVAFSALISRYKSRRSLLYCNPRPDPTPPPPRTARCEQLSRFLFHFKLCGFLIHNTYMTVIRARCFSVGLNVKSYGKKTGLLRVAVVCHVSSATVFVSSRASNEGSRRFHINPYSH